MTNPTPTPSPRLCTLWGSTFDANDNPILEVEHCSEIPFFPIYAYVKDDKFSLYEKEMFCDKGVADTQNTVASLTLEFTSALHNALHPWYDVQDAINRDLFIDDAKFVVIPREGEPFFASVSIMEFNACETELLEEIRCWSFYSDEMELNSNEVIAFKPLSFIEGVTSADPVEAEKQLQAMRADRERFACVKSWEG